MKVLYSPRRSGRTTKLIEWAAEHDAYIICATETEARRIAAQAKAMNLTIRFPVTFSELPMRGAWPGLTYAVDNADWLIEQFVGSPVDFVTIEDKEDQP